MLSQPRVTITPNLRQFKDSFLTSYCHILSQTTKPLIAHAYTSITTMSLPDLPNELILKFFKSCNDFASSTALGATCQQFHDIWKANSTAVCNAIASRTFECYDELSFPVDMESQMSTSPEQQEDKKATAATARRIKRFFMYQENGRKALDKFVKLLSYNPEGSFVRHCDFLKAYYRASGLLMNPNGSFPKSMLSSLNLLELFQVRETVHLDFRIPFVTPSERLPHSFFVDVDTLCYDLANMANLPYTISSMGNSLQHVHKEIWIDSLSGSEHYREAIPDALRKVWVFDLLTAYTGKSQHRLSGLKT